MRKNLLIPLAIAFSLIALVLPAQNINDILTPVTGTYALTNVKIVQKPGQVIEKGTIIIKNGLIEAVGENATIPKNAKVLPCDSLMVYAGFIDGMSYTGIPKPDNSQGNRRPEVKNPGEPGNKLAGIQPELKAEDAINPKDKSISALRKIGFTAANVVPRGRMLPGSSALVLLAGKSADEMVIQNETALYSQFVGAPRVYPATVIAVMSKWRELYKQAEQAKAHEKAYDSNPQGMKRPSYDPTLQAFYPVINQDKPVLFRASDVKSAYRVLTLQEELGFPLVIADLKQGWHIMDEIKSKKIPVFLSLDLPSVKEKKEEEEKEMSEEVKQLQKRQEETLKEYNSQAATFEKAGIEFGFSSLSSKSKDVRSNLKKMIEHGLSENTALAALTTVPAKQLGVDNIMGSVENGKIANLVVTDGSYFDDKSNIRYVFVDGQLFEYEVKAKKKEGDPSKKVDVAGTWSYTVKAPDRERDGTLTLKSDDGELSGSISNPETGEETDVEDLELSGNELTFTSNVNMGPQSIKLEFSVIIDGDSMEGNVSVGEFGTFEVEGERNSTPE